MSLKPNGPFQKGGIRKSDKILDINGHSFADKKELTEFLNQTIQVGVPLKVNTSRGLFDITPRLTKQEQCYWEVHAGGVAQSSSGAYVNQYAGVGGSSSSAYQRFFKATCRLSDGYIHKCNWNYQE